MERYSNHYFEILKTISMVDNKGTIRYIYAVYCQESDSCLTNVIQDTAVFDSYQEARFAAIGHIVFLENGEFNAETD